jgi:hypothetical protein
MGKIKSILPLKLLLSTKRVGTHFDFSTVHLASCPVLSLVTVIHYCSFETEVTRP